MRRGLQAANDEEVEEIPRSWRNRKDFNDLLRLPRAVPSSFESWLVKRERTRGSREISLEGIIPRKVVREEERVVAAGGPRLVETVNGAPA